MNKFTNRFAAGSLLLISFAHAAEIRNAKADEIAKWKFDENAGAIAHDASGNNCHASIAGAMWTSWQSAPAKTSSALSFDGILNGVNIAKVPAAAINLGSDFTISFWARMGTSKGIRVLMAKDEKVPGHFDVYANPAGEIIFFAPDLGDFSSATVVSDDQWHHLAVTYDNASVKMYVDGILGSATPKAGPITATNEKFQMGALPDGSLPYDGALDEVRIYKRALSAKEITADRDSPVPISGIPAIASWNLNENSGSAALDASANGNNASITGTSWIAGKYGSALLWKANANYAVIPNSNINPGDQFSIGMWIKAPYDVCERTLLTKGGKTDAGHFELNITPTNKLQFFASALGKYESTTAVGDNAWHFVSVVDNGTQVLVYVDGELQSTGNATASIPNASLEMRFGAMTDGGNPYTGLIGETTICNSALTDEEIRRAFVSDPRYQLDQTASPAPSGGLMDMWAMEGLQDRIIEENANKFDGFMHIATWEPGKAGNALQLYGVSQLADPTQISYAEIPDFSETFGSAFSISLLVKSAPKNMIYKKQIILSKGTKGAGSFSLFTDADGFLHFESGDLGEIKSHSQVFVDANWHHLAVTYNGSRLEVFVDGYSVAFSNREGSIQPLTSSLFIGGQTSSDCYWGAIDQVRIYNRALTTSEIASLAHEAGPPADPVAQTGTVVAKVDCGTSTDGLDGYSADKAFVPGGWGYVDGGLSSNQIYQQGTFSIYDKLYMLKTYRESTGNLSYKFPVPNGKYKVNLYFVEPTKSEAGQRAFSVSMEGEKKLSSYDILADAKARFVGVRKSFPGIQVTDGSLEIDFVKGTDNIVVSGIDLQKEDGMPLPAPVALRQPVAPLFLDPPIKKQFRDTSSVYNLHTGKWMHFGLLVDIDDSFMDDSVAALEMSNNGRGPWTWLGIPTGITFNDFAPDFVYDRSTGTYHMFTGSMNHGIRHYVNKDHTLMDWDLLAANCVPGNNVMEWDPEVWQTDDKMWHMTTSHAQYDSHDLIVWTEHRRDYLAYWPMLEGWGGVDLPKNYNNIAFAGVTWGDAPTGYQSAIFNGTPGSYGQIPVSKLNIGNKFTFSVWIKAAASNSYQVILARDVKASNAHYDIGITPENKLFFYAPVKGAVFSSSDVAADGTWHHVAIVYSGDTMTFFTDGVRKNTVPVPADAIPESAAPARLAGLVEGGMHYNGGIGKFLVYNRPLEDAEINNLFTVPYTYIDKYTFPGFENSLIFKFENMWWGWNDQEPMIFKSTDGITGWTPTGVKKPTPVYNNRVGNIGNYAFGWDAIVQSGRCYLTYGSFCETKPIYAGTATKIALNVLEAKVIDGNLYIESNAKFDFDLKPAIDGSRKETASAPGRPNTGLGAAGHPDETKPTDGNQAKE
jgi:hypothetical protein